MDCLYLVDNEIIKNSNIVFKVMELKSIYSKVWIKNI